MKYRIKIITYENEYTRYIPQKKRLLFWNNMVKTYDEYGNFLRNIYYDKMEDALRIIEAEKPNKDFKKTEYKYID